MSQTSTGMAMAIPATRSAPAPRFASGMPREWAWLLVLVAVDLVWCWWIGLTLTALRQPLLTIAGLLVLNLLCRQWGRAARLADACEAAALWIGLSLAACVLTYLFASWSLAPFDRAFDRLDAALGFDWLAWKQFVEAHPPLRRLLAVAYASLRPQLLLAILFLALTGQRLRNRLLFRAVFIVLVLASLISGVVPALSAFSYYGLADQARYLHALLELRGGELAFAVPELRGIVTMPSCHAAFAVILIHLFARRGPLGTTVACWNLLMLASIPSEGGHYLVDVIAGVVLAWAALWLARASLSRLSAPADARTP